MALIIEDLAKAASALKKDDVVAMPTETVYGLAGNALSDRALKKIFALKNRPLDHPLIMHVGHKWDLSPWVATIPDYATALMDAFWPGPLTLVFHSRPGSIPSLLNGGQTTIAIRCPKHPISQSLLSQINFPLAAPSANPFGKISPTTAAHVAESFPEAALLILEGGRCQVGIESTILAATDPDRYQILRYGAIGEAKIHEILPSLLEKEAESIRAPGRLESHYQPEKPLLSFSSKEALLAFYQSQPESEVFVLYLNERPEYNKELSYQLPLDPEKLAFELYYQLRRADGSRAKKIAVELPTNAPSWAAIRERLLKASIKSL